MNVERDFADFCALLNAKRVDFLLVGGYAVMFHGAPRSTGDMDVLVRPDPENVRRLLAAVGEFGFPVEREAPEYLLERHKILEMGRVPVQIHVMTRITGVSWEEAWSSRVAGSYGNVPVAFIGLDALLKNKTAAGRPKDLADVDALRRKPS